jgi:two-component system KDP operon response regulator KdpE
MTSPRKILIIEDDSELIQLLRYHLEQRGYQVLSATNGVDGITLLQQEAPHLVILDVMMPRMNGWETCKLVRQCSEVPVIMLTALAHEADKVRGLELGADDYVTKPFGLAELTARVRAALRRSGQPLAASTIVQIDERLTVDRAQQQVIVDGHETALSPTEFRILDCFLDNAGRILTHQSLLTQVWGWEYMDEKDYLKVYIHHLRKKIEPKAGEPRYIVTERGLGYRFQADYRLMSR